MITALNFVGQERLKDAINLIDKKADAYCSRQRGQNERLNRDLRKFFPKGTEFENRTHSSLQNAVTKINSFPRRKFNGRSASVQKMKLS